MATLQAIQETEQNILRWFHQICEENGLKYTAVFGTMLGAVRHQGFIPWDDDVDVFLPLEDGQKLRNVFRSEEYFLQCPENDIEAPYLMMKIRKNGTVMEDLLQRGLNMHKGVWIDIFLYTNAGKSKIAKKLQVFLIKALQSYRCRYYHVLNDPQKKLYPLLCRLPVPFCLWLDRRILGAIRVLGSKKSPEIVCIENENSVFFDRKFLENRTLYEFSGDTIWGVKDYDAYLTGVYGKNYMTPIKWGHIEDYGQVIC
ncbi:MAG: LicD family protein [Lachnospiraceae bacterium]|nr:LicD family protein [Lachnospiraceae bacterium]